MDRPKRKYTVTARVLAACRRNLARANAVDQEIRYRLTPKRLIACHKNLVRAQAVRRTSPRYGAIRHGAYCLSLERSLELAGETKSDFISHLSDFDEAFAPEGEEQAKLVRALALASWRRLRVFRGQARWEERRLGLCLAEAIRRAQTVSPEWIGAESARELMLDVLDAFAEMPRVDHLLERLNRRLGRLVELWLQSCTGERVSLRYFALRACGDIGMGERPEAVLANPLVGPARVLESLAPSALAERGERPLSVSAPAFWRRRSWEAVFYRLAELRRADPGLKGDVAYRLVLEEFAPRERPWWRHVPTSGYTASLENLTQAFRAALLPDPSGLGGEGALPQVRTLVRELAEIAWQRLEYFRGCAEAEAEKVKEFLRKAPIYRREGNFLWGAPIHRGERAEPVSPRASSALGEGWSPRTAPRSIGETSDISAGPDKIGAGTAARNRRHGGARDLAAQLLKVFEPEATRWRETSRLERELEASFRGLFETTVGVATPG